MKRHSLALQASGRWEYPEDAYSPLDFASHMRVVWVCLDPLPTRLKGLKNILKTMGGARSIAL